MEKDKKQSKQRKKNKDSYNIEALREYTLEIFSRNPTKAFNYKQIAKRLGVTDEVTKRLIVKVLHNLTEKDKLDEIHAGKYQFKVHTVYVNGKVELSRNGNAYVVSPESEQDIFIARNNLNRALNGDEVRVYVFARRKSKGLEGEIIEICKRAKQSFVGIIQIGASYAFFAADDANMPYDIFIPKDKLKDAKNGEKVVVQIDEWPVGAKSPVGVVIDVLGTPGEHLVEMNAIMADFELPVKFSDEVHQAAEAIDAGITAKEIAKRRDFRNITTFTIDPEDAKDFDDALSLQKLPNGNWEVGVHIADVTHYVQEDTLLDKEAFDRATSVYLVDRVIPMLPEKLSNNICSLRPNEEKLTFSVVFEMNDDAEVLHEWFGRTVIKSDRRFSYEEAQERIEKGEGDFWQEIQYLDTLAKKLREIRYKNNSIDFDRDEVKFRLDETGKPIEVYFKVMKDSNKLIEEFMLLANKKVAELIGKPAEGKAKTFVYRVHDKPNLEKMTNFAQFIRRFGHSINIENAKQISKSLNKLLTAVKGKAEQDLVENLAIRSMAKAIYTTENIGHYGLAFQHYTHFTSPIRRFPDMMVHRLLAKYMDNEKSVAQKKYESMCKHSSDMENRAALAERASVKYKQVEYMKGQVGNIFDGIISSITDWGMYVEIVGNKIEGMVALRDIDDDYYYFDEKNYRIIGQRTHQIYQLGDKVKIQIVRANLQKKQLDFMLA